MRRAGILFIIMAAAVPAAAQDGPAERDFKAALAIQNERELEKACRQLVIQGTPDSARLILTAFARKDLETDVYWILIRAASAFSNTNALDVVADYVVKNKKNPVANDLTMALHNNFTPGVEAVMLKILGEGTEEQQLLALDHLADIGTKPTVEAVVEILRKEGDKAASTEVRRRMFVVLKSITRENYGESHSNWIGWWDNNKSKDWKELGKGSTEGHALGATRAEEFKRVQENKVLIIHAGSKCKCKKNHDLDPNLTKVLNNENIKYDQVTKDQWEAKNGKLDSGETFNERDYIAIIAICTHIREHCACPDCKPGGQQSMRLFQ